MMVARGDCVCMKIVVPAWLHHVGWRDHGDVESEVLKEDLPALLVLPCVAPEQGWET